MDIMTLAAAKSYTDKKTANGGAADLSNYYTKQEIDDKKFITQDQLPDEGYAVDDSLTMEGVAADAKATGDRLTDIEYQTVTTDLAFSHKDLPEGEKTVTVQSGDTWGNTVYVSSGEDLVPRTTFNRVFPYNGVTVEKDGYTYHLSGTATANSSIYFTHILTSTTTESVRGLGSKILKLVTLADKVWGNSVRVFIQFFDENKTNLSGQIKNSVSPTTTSNVVDIPIPENTAYMGIWLQVSAGTVLNNDVQVYLNLAEKTQASTEFENIAVNDDESTYVMSFPYESIVSVKAPITEYINYKANNAKGDTATYLTPEAFGAIGDGYADDTEAVKACITKAAETTQTVFMAKKYLISSPIEIFQNGLNLIANDIVYSGTDVAIKIQGSNNTLKLHNLTSSGIGIVFTGASEKHMYYNSIDINTIQSNSHGIVFYFNQVGIGQNTIRFNLIKCNGTGCYGIAYLDHENKVDTAYIGENNFYGGRITNCEWACYKVCGNAKFYGIHVEGEVEGGFYIASGVRIIQPRFAEGARDGSYPFFKILNGEGVKIDTSTICCINDIDISENVDYYERVDGSQSPAHESMLGIIEIPFITPRTEVGENLGTFTLLTNKAYIWGKHLIMTPYMSYRKAVTTAVLDTRLIDKPKNTKEETQASAQALSQLPTKFVVDTINTEIYLHSSYCAFGFNEFEVEQANGFTCKIYDVHENLIFDGTNKGDGLYKLNVYKDADICINRQGTKGLLSVDFMGHYWQVLKLGATIV